MHLRPLALAALLLAALPARAATPTDAELVEAVKRGDEAAVKRLLEQGANPSATSAQRFQGPDDWYEERGPVLRWLLAGDEDPSHPELEMGARARLVEALLRAGAETGTRYDNGLHMCEVVELNDLVPTLLAYGACDDKSFERFEAMLRAHGGPAHVRSAIEQERLARRPIAAKRAPLGSAVPLGPIAASSTLPHKSDLYQPAHLSDQDLATAWVEGSPFHGLGETLTVELEQPVSGLYVVNGYAKDAPTFAKNARVRQLRVWVGGKPLGTALLEDTAEPQRLELGPLLAPAAALPAGAELRLQVLSVYPGTTYKDTCLTELLGAP